MLFNESASKHQENSADERGTMDTNRILIAINEEISRLQQVRELLATAGATVPAKSSNRAFSEEARARIAAAQKRRWAAHREANKSARPMADAA